MGPLGALLLGPWPSNPSRPLWCSLLARGLSLKPPEGPAWRAAAQLPWGSQAWTRPPRGPGQDQEMKVRGSLCPNGNALGIGVCWPHRTVMDAVAPAGLAHSLPSIRSRRHPRDGGGESEVDRCTAMSRPRDSKRKGQGRRGRSGPGAAGRRPSGQRWVCLGKQGLCRVTLVHGTSPHLALLSPRGPKPQCPRRPTPQLLLPALGTSDQSQ